MFIPKEKDLYWDFKVAFHRAKFSPKGFCGINFLNSDSERLWTELVRDPS